MVERLLNATADEAVGEGGGEEDGGEVVLGGLRISKGGRQASNSTDEKGNGRAEAPPRL